MSALVGYKPEFQTDGTGKWYANALVFPTEAEAQAYAQDLYSRWTLVHSTRVVPVPEPASHRFSSGVLEHARKD